MKFTTALTALLLFVSCGSASTSEQNKLSQYIRANAYLVIDAATGMTIAQKKPVLGRSRCEHHEDGDCACRRDLVEGDPLVTITKEAASVGGAESGTSRGRTVPVQRSSHGDAGAFRQRRRDGGRDSRLRVASRVRQSDERMVPRAFPYELELRRPGGAIFKIGIVSEELVRVTRNFFQFRSSTRLPPSMNSRSRAPPEERFR